jgi:hypothetical protein
LQRSQRYASASFFCKTKSRVLRTLARRASFLPVLEQEALFTRELEAFSASDDLMTFTIFTSSLSSSACTMLFIPYF